MAHFGRGISPFTSLILASALWGIATVISKAYLASVPPITFLLVQLIPSVGVLWLLILATGTAKWQGLVPLVLLGLLNPGLSYSLSMLGLAKTTASATTLLWAAEPALIVLVAWLLRQEVVTARLLAATGVAACGVLLLSGLVGSGDVARPNVEGAALVLGGVLCCAIYTVLSRSIASSISPLPAIAIQQTAALVFVAAIWALQSQGDATTSEFALSWREVIGGAVSGLMYYAAAFWFYLNALRSITATTAGMFLNLIPVFGVTSAYLFLGERLSQIQWIGGAIILLAVLGLLTCAAPKARSTPG